jgi:hypothetical protein
MIIVPTRSVTSNSGLNLRRLVSQRKEKADFLHSHNSYLKLNHVSLQRDRSQWPCGLRRGCAAARLLGLRVRIPPKACLSVCCECCVLSGRGLCDELITRPEESYRVCGVSKKCVIVKSRTMRRPRPPRGCRAIDQKKAYNVDIIRFGGVLTMFYHMSKHSAFGLCRSLSVSKIQMKLNAILRTLGLWRRQVSGVWGRLLFWDRQIGLQPTSHRH